MGSETVKPRDAVDTSVHNAAAKTSYEAIDRILRDVPIPRMVRLKQHFRSTGLADVRAEIAGCFARAEIGSTVRSGDRVALTVGSRGIASLPELTRAVVAELTARGAEPFIVPAMGSHGGATAAGQRQLLASLGITEENVGAPIRATMETVEVGRTDDGKAVRVDRYAAEADAVIVMNRIKPHTAYRGLYESGLMKMMAIGLGKQEGAESCHAEGFGRMDHYVPAFGSVVLKALNVLFGIALVENQLDELCSLEAILPSEIPDREPELLDKARGLMPSLGFPEFDVLVVDKIGKNYSGDGMDPNITGRFCTPYATGGPTGQRAVVLDLSEETHGNFIGLGLADFTTRRVFDKLDLAATYPNALTSRVASVARIPAVMANDRQAIQAAIHTSVGVPAGGIRMVRIANTAHIEEIEISESLLDEARRRSDVTILDSPRALEFDEQGALRF